MPRAAKPARLWLRPASADREATWVILDRGSQHSTGCGASAREEAEERLAGYLASKREPGQRQKRRADQTLIADVLSVYLDEVAPTSASPKKVAMRIGRLAEWWGTKPLSAVTPTSCAEYVASRSKGGGRRDLEDLRSAINHHAKRELHSGFVDVTLPGKGKARVKYLTRSEVARLLWVCWRHKRVQKPPRGPRKGQVVESRSFYDLRHIARFILMGIYTGSRSTPILRASIYAASGRAFVDVDAGRYYRLPEDMTEAENKQSPIVRLSPHLMMHIRRWRDTKAIGQFIVEWDGRPVKSIKTGWKTAVSLAGIVGRATPHTLRHTCVTWLKQGGWSSFDVGNFVGMSERMVEHVYGHYDPDFQSGISQSAGRKPRAGAAMKRQRNGENKP